MPHSAAERSVGLGTVSPAAQAPVATVVGASPEVRKAPPAARTAAPPSPTVPPPSPTPPPLAPTATGPPTLAPTATDSATPAPTATGPAFTGPAIELLVATLIVSAPAVDFAPFSQVNTSLYEETAHTLRVDFAFFYAVPAGYVRIDALVAGSLRVVYAVRVPAAVATTVASLNELVRMQQRIGVKSLGLNATSLTSFGAI